MAVAIATSAEWDTAGATATSYSITLPSGIAVGNLLLMFFSKSNVTDDLTNTGWTRIATTGADSEFKGVFARIADGSEGSTASFSATTTCLAAAVTYCITGAKNGLTSSEIAVSSAVNSGGNFTTADPPNLTPSWDSAENLWFSVAFINDAATGALVSYSTNYSLGQAFNVNGTNNAGQVVAVCARLLTATSENPGVITWTTARRSDAYTVAIRPSASFIFNPAPFTPYLVR